MVYYRRKGEVTMDKRANKKEGQELQDYLAFRRRGSIVRSKKGKGSYRRKSKHRTEEKGE